MTKFMWVSAQILCVRFKLLNTSILNFPKTKHVCLLKLDSITSNYNIEISIPTKHRAAIIAFVYNILVVKPKSLK